ncbi:MAG: sigma factor-like helix-turn-helix DNA-binding protein [Acidimicrobiia bacterium]
MTPHLRPVERRILALRAEGVAVDEIARRFRRSPQHVERVLSWTQIPRESEPDRPDGLRPIERRVLAMRGEGLSYDEIGRRFNRGPDHIRRVERYAGFRTELA